MDEMQAVGFRTKIFGGFNRRDVLEHIKGVYYELWLVREENQALRKRCEALEAEMLNTGVEIPEPAPKFEAPKSAPKFEISEPEPAPDLEAPAPDVLKQEDRLEEADVEVAPELEVEAAVPETPEAKPDLSDADLIALVQGGKKPSEPETEPEVTKPAVDTPAVHEAMPEAIQLQDEPVPAHKGQSVRVKVRRKRPDR